MFDPNELNEVATLLHVASEVMTNHPNMASIARACQRRLNEIDTQLKAEEAKEAEANKKVAADASAKAYVAPKPGDPNYIAPEKSPSPLDKPVDLIADPNAGVEVERRV